MFATEELTAEKLETWVAALEDEVDNNRRKHELTLAQEKAGKVEKGAGKRTAELLAGSEAELARVQALRDDAPASSGKPAAGDKAAEPDDEGRVGVEVPD